MLNYLVVVCGKFYGMLVLMVLINVDGSVMWIDINCFFGYKVFDELVCCIVQMVVFYLVFLLEIWCDIDVLEIICIWYFIQGDQLFVK